MQFENVLIQCSLWQWKERTSCMIIILYWFLIQNAKLKIVNSQSIYKRSFKKYHLFRWNFLTSPCYLNRLTKWFENSRKIQQFAQITYFIIMHLTYYDMQQFCTDCKLKMLSLLHWYILGLNAIMLCNSVRSKNVRHPISWVLSNAHFFRFKSFKSKLVIF